MTFYFILEWTRKTMILFKPYTEHEEQCFFFLRVNAKDISFHLRVKAEHGDSSDLTDSSRIAAIRTTARCLSNPSERSNIIRWKQTRGNLQGVKISRRLDEWKRRHFLCALEWRKLSYDNAWNGKNREMTCSSLSLRCNLIQSLRQRSFRHVLFLLMLRWMTSSAPIRVRLQCKSAWYTYYDLLW